MLWEDEDRVERGAPEPEGTSPACVEQLLHRGGSLAPHVSVPSCFHKEGSQQSFPEVPVLAWPGSYLPSLEGPQRPQPPRGGGNHSMVSIAGLRNGWLLPAIHCRAQDGMVYLLLFLNELRLHLGPARESGPSGLPRLPTRHISRGHLETPALLQRLVQGRGQNTGPVVTDASMWPWGGLHAVKSMGAAKALRVHGWAWASQHPGPELPLSEGRGRSPFLPREPTSPSEMLSPCPRILPGGDSRQLHREDRAFLST